MLFNSYEYLIFLPVVFAIYWALGFRQDSRSCRAQNLFVVLASYFFYGCWDWRFLSLIIVTTLSSWVTGRLIDRPDGTSSPISRKAVLVANIVLNIGILCVFKYLNFFADTFANVLSAIGVAADMPTLHIILPVGISFYTFQAIGYTIDVYRRQSRATTDLVAFAAYISFFPQLVAGPIERSTRLLPQFLAKRQFSYEAATDGCRQMLWGFVKKVVVADNCAMTVNMVWADYADYSSTMHVVAALLFSMQIYCDFSGYSDIAIGTAKLFGIRLSTNFRTPYFASNIRDFWRRWHITLMTWLRDYIYIPLGGSRKGAAKTVRNTFVVFFVSGLWHGANFTFIVWGLYHAALIVLSPKPSTREKGLDGTQGTVRHKRLGGMVACLVTFLLVTVGWVIFRAPTLADAVAFFTGTVSGPWTLADFSGFKPLAVSAICLAVEWSHGFTRFDTGCEHALDFGHGSTRFDTGCGHALDFGHDSTRFDTGGGSAQHSTRRILYAAPMRWLVYYVLLYSLNALSAKQESFIYFQF